MPLTYRSYVFNIQRYINELRIFAFLGIIKFENEFIKVFTVFILPLNSCCNPFLYAILTKKFQKECVMICKVYILKLFILRCLLYLYCLWTHVAILSCTQSWLNSSKRIVLWFARYNYLYFCLMHFKNQNSRALFSFKNSLTCLIIQYH